MTEQAHSIQLDENLGLGALSKLYDTLREFRGKPLSLDASAVQHINGLCLQILLSVQKTWNAENIAFAIHSHSDAMKNALTHTGITSLAQQEAR